MFSFVTLLLDISKLPLKLLHKWLVQPIKGWAEPNNMIAESKPTNNIDPCNTQTANQWMYVLPAQAASRDQFWRKMRHWQIKWSSSEAYPLFWNGINSPNMKHRLKLYEMALPGCLNRTIMLTAVIPINIVAIISHWSLFSFILGVWSFNITCSMASHYEPADDLLIWTRPPNNLHNCFITLSLSPCDKQGAKSWTSPSSVSLSILNW